MARLGASSTARAVAPPAATVRSVAAPRPGVSAAPVGVAPAVLRVGAPAPVAAGVAPPPLAPVPRAAPAAVAPPAVRSAGAVAAAAARRCAPVGAAVVRRGIPDAARVGRRAATPWRLLGRERLAAAWEAVQRDHGGGLADLRLAGVYGPLPRGAVRAAALGADGRLAVVLGGRRPGRTGDVALARDVATGRLVRADVPYPGPGGVRRGLR